MQQLIGNSCLLLQWEEKWSQKGSSRELIKKTPFWCKIKETQNVSAGGKVIQSKPFIFQMRKLPLFQPARAVRRLPPSKLMDSGYRQCWVSICLCLCGIRLGGVPTQLHKSWGKKEDSEFICSMSHFDMEIHLLVGFFLPPKFPIAPRDSILPVYYLNQSSSASPSVTSVSLIIILTNQ